MKSVLLFCLSLLIFTSKVEGLDRENQIGFTHPSLSLNYWENTYNIDLIKHYRSNDFFKLAAKLEVLDNEFSPASRVEQIDRYLTLGLVQIYDRNCYQAELQLRKLEALQADFISPHWFYFYLLKARHFICLDSISESLSVIELLRNHVSFECSYQLFDWHSLKADIYRANSLYTEMRNSIYKAYEVAEDIDEDFFRLAVLYELGFVYAELRDYPTALNYLDKALDLALQQENYYYTRRIKACAGISSIELGKYSRGVELLQESETLANDLGLPQLCGNSAFYAKGLWNIGEYSRALEEAAFAWNSVKDSDDLRDRRNVLHAIYDIYKASGQLEKALEVGEKLAEHRQQLFERQFGTILSEIDARYALREADLKLTEQRYLLESEKSKAAKKNILLFTALGILVLLFLLLVVVHFFYKTRNRLNKVLRDQNKELAKANRTKKQFFEEVSREFRNPLTIIMGTLEKIQKRLPVNKMNAEIDESLRYAQNMSTLIGQILEISELNPKSLNSPSPLVKLNEWVKRLNTNFEEQFSRSKTEIKITIKSDEYSFIEFDHSKTELVIYNILNKLAKDNDALQSLCVQIGFEPDTGKGKRVGKGWLNVDFCNFELSNNDKIKTSSVKHIETVDSFNGDSKQWEVVNSLLELIGGQMKEITPSNTSEHVYRISIPVRVFNFEFGSNLESFPVREMNQPDKRNLQNEGIGQKVILLIEKDQFAAALFKNALSEKYLALVAESTETAQNLLRRRKIDLLIMESNQGAVDGLKWLRSLRRSSFSFSNIPVLMLTVNSSDHMKIKMLESGADAVLVKPFKTESLLAEVRSLIESRQRSKSEKVLSMVNEADSEDLIKLTKAEKIIVSRLNDQSLKIGDIASQLNISVRSLERLFKKYHKITPSKFIQNKRLMLAYHLLVEGRCNSISELREKTGFNSPAYFSRLFSKKFKTNPSSLLQRENSF